MESSAQLWIQGNVPYPKSGKPCQVSHTLGDFVYNVAFKTRVWGDDTCGWIQGESISSSPLEKPSRMRTNQTCRASHKVGYRCVRFVFCASPRICAHKYPNASARSISDCIINSHTSKRTCYTGEQVNTKSYHANISRLCHSLVPLLCITYKVYFNKGTVAGTWLDVYAPQNTIFVTRTASKRRVLTSLGCTHHVSSEDGVFNATNQHLLWFLPLFPWFELQVRKLEASSATPTGTATKTAAKPGTSRGMAAVKAFFPLEWVLTIISQYPGMPSPGVPDPKSMNMHWRISAWSENTWYTFRPTQSPLECEGLVDLDWWNPDQLETPCWMSI